MNPAESEALSALRMWGEVRRLAATARASYLAKVDACRPNGEGRLPDGAMEQLRELPKGPESRLCDLLLEAAKVARDLAEKAADRLVAEGEGAP